MLGTTQSIINWVRSYVPDPTIQSVAVRDFEIGRTSSPTGVRETFFLKHSPTGSVKLFVEPYTFVSTASLSTAATGSNVFMFASSTLSCVFPNGSTDVARKPFKFKPVKAEYEYNRRLPYAYTDTEIAEFIPLAVGFLNNTYGFSYTFTGTIPTTVGITGVNSNDKELISKTMAMLIRRKFVDEQKARGLGIRFRGPMQSIDTVAQMKDYQETTKELLKDIVAKADELSRAGLVQGQVIDVYTENVVTT